MLDSDLVWESATSTLGTEKFVAVSTATSTLPGPSGRSSITAAMYRRASSSPAADRACPCSKKTRSTEHGSGEDVVAGVVTPSELPGGVSVHTRPNSWCAAGDAIPRRCAPASTVPTAPYVHSPWQAPQFSRTEPS